MGDFIEHADFAKHAAATAILARDPSSLTGIDPIDPTRSMAITDLVGTPTSGRIAIDCAWFFLGTGQIAFQEIRGGAGHIGTQAFPLTRGQGEPELISTGTSNSPFEYLEAASEILTQVGILITAFRLVSNLPYRERLADRVTALVKAVVEEDSLDQRSADSLKNMLQFLESNAKLRYPVIVLTPDHHFRAIWRSGPDAHLAIEFGPQGNAVFVVFSQDPYRKDLIRRATGVVSKEGVIEVLRPYQFERWTNT